MQGPSFLLRRSGPVFVDRSAKGAPFVWFGENVAEAGKQAHIAIQQAASAISSATIAVDAETGAIIAENAAASSAGVAAAKASTATVQASAATVQASTATAQASTATAQASIATAQAGIATVQASSAISSATIASTGAGTATAQASTATVQASTATTQASTATAQASTATAQASTATTQASAAASSATVANAAYVNMQTLYLGPKAAAPAKDNAGGALVNGAQYFNTTIGEMRVRNAGAWVATYLPAGGYLAKTQNLADVPDKPTALANLGVDTALALKAPKASPELTDDINLNGRIRTKAPTAGTGTFDCSINNRFTATVSANMTIAFTNVPAGSFLAQIDVTYTAGVITYPANLKHADGKAPQYEAGLWKLFFDTKDGGANWELTAKRYA